MRPSGRWRWRPGRGPADPLYPHSGFLLREWHQHPESQQHPAPGRNPGRREWKTERGGTHGPALCPCHCKCPLESFQGKHLKMLLRMIVWLCAREKERNNLLILVLERLVNMRMAPPFHDSPGMSAEDCSLYLHANTNLASWKSIQMTVGAQRWCICNFFFVYFIFLDSTFYVMEGSCFDQSEPVLQRKPLHGSVGANHQPARAMKRQKACERTW